MSKFFPLKVKRINTETPTCVSIAFDVPLSLKDTFKYKQGQYLTFKLKINNEELRRSYSICSNPLKDDEWIIAVKKVSGGKVSTYFNEGLKVGDVLEVMPPEGRFYNELNADHKKTYVLFAGGSGITPMLSIIKASLQAEPHSRLVLFYGNQDEISTIFKKELEEIQNQNPDRFAAYFIYDKPSIDLDPLYIGILSKEKIESILDKFTFEPETEYFICGPGPMMDNVVHALEGDSVDKKFIHVEYFTVSAEEISKSKSEAQNQFVDCDMLLVLDGDESMIHVKAGQTILEAALQAHLDAPYSCRAGSCCTCRAKLIEGKVKMTVNYALLDAEIEEGFILTCQAHPITPNLVVDYDRGR